MLCSHFIFRRRTVNAELLEREETELLDTVDDVKGFLQSPKYHRDIPKYIERTNVVAGRVAVLKSTQDDKREIDTSSDRKCVQ